MCFATTANPALMIARKKNKQINGHQREAGNISLHRWSRKLRGHWGSEQGQKPRWQALLIHLRMKRTKHHFATGSISHCLFSTAAWPGQEERPWHGQDGAKALSGRQETAQRQGAGLFPSPETSVRGTDAQPGARQRLWGRTR